MKRHSNLTPFVAAAILCLIPLFSFATVINVPDDYETIQAAIDEAEEGDTVLVDPGVYEENVNFNGNNVVVGSRFITTGDEDFISETIIDGGGYRGNEGSGGDYSTVLFCSGESAEAQLIGFTIRNGYGAGACGGMGAEEEYCFGGGIFCDNSSPTLSHLVVTGNEAFYGGGICIWRADPALSCIVVSNNRAAFGGGVHIYSGNSTLDHLDIHDNNGNGSAMFIGDPWGYQETCLTLINSTISRNSGGSGTIYINSGGQVVLYNTIIWDNEGSAVGVYAEEDDGFSWIGVDFSDIEGGRDGIALVGNAGMYWNPGNIDSDPLFIDPDNGDFHLTEDSPCIDAGAPESPHDPDNTRADMGAYFFPNYGEGSPQIVVDPGALDFPIGENLQPEAELTIGNVGNRVLRFWTYAGETDPEWAWDNDFDWLEWEPRAGEVEPGEETIMNVMIDARDMIIDFGGVRRNLYISSNDPDNPVIVVGIFIHLTIAVWSEEAGFPDMMDWNAVYDVMELNNDYEIDFRIDGIMPDRLVVDEIRLDSPVFAVDQNGFELDPWESRGMTVTFRTAERGEFEATMFIISNNWENREFPVQLHAKIPINPPDIRDNVNWWIALNAGVGDCQDNDNYAGGAEGASFDFDEDFDLPEPPHAPDRYVQLYFPHPDWENLLGDNFTSDIAPDSAQWETIIVWDFEVNTDQTDQAVTLGFDYSEEIDQGFNLVLFDVETEETVNLWENQTYEYDAGEGGVHQFQLTYGDLVPPVVTVTQPNGGENLHPGDLVNVIWEAEDLTGVVGSVLYLSIERGLNWTQIGSTEGADFDLEWEIPDLYSPYCLLKVECTDAVGNTGSDQSDDFFAITPQTSAFDFVTGWNLISIPLVPEDNSLETLFGDDIEGQYHVYDYAQSRGFARVDEIDCGPGYWLGTYADVSLDLEGSAYIDTVVCDLDQGWNLLGDPLFCQIPLDSVLFRAADVTYSLEEAIDAELIQPVLYNWLAENNSYTEEDAFSIWLGYWFSVLAEDVQMLIYPVVPEEEGRRDNPDEATPEQWRLTITADIENTADLITTLGVDTNATDGFDVRYDFPEPPVPPSGDWVTAYFHHEDWNQGLGRKFNRDIRAGLDYQDQVEWAMTVETNGEEAVTLRWPDIQATIPADYSIVLADPEADRVINLSETDSYSYVSAGQRVLTVRVTSFNAVKPDPYQGVPTEFAIASIHPNPFNAATTIVYGLPTATDVSLTVYDVSGRKVAALVNSCQSAGYHSVVFDGKGQAAGVYIMKLTADGDVSSQKVTLVK